VDEDDSGRADSAKLKLVPTNNTNRKPKLMSEKNDGELRELIKSLQGKEQRRRSQSGNDNLPPAA